MFKFINLYTSHTISIRFLSQKNSLSSYKSFYTKLLLSCRSMNSTCSCLNRTCISSDSKLIFIQHLFTYIIFKKEVSHEWISHKGQKINWLIWNYEGIGQGSLWVGYAGEKKGQTVCSEENWEEEISKIKKIVSGFCREGIAKENWSSRNCEIEQMLSGWQISVLCSRVLSWRRFYLLYQTL